MFDRPLSLLLVVAGYSTAAFAQVPVIQQGGVVNAASWSSLVAPGELVAIFGSNLASGRTSAAPPLPFSLGGTSVTINGTPAPIEFVSANQVNVQVPSALTAPSFDTVLASVVVTTPAGSSVPVNVVLTAGYPGFFTQDVSGCGQASALNIAPDGAVSLNSASNSAAPGDYIALFGTGFGLASVQPRDGIAPEGPVALRTVPGVLIDNNISIDPSYAGLAPSLAGVDQLNFQVPSSVRNGCSVPVYASQTFASPAVTISIQKGRGQCTNPAIQPYGRLFLGKTTFSLPGSNPIPEN